MKFHGRKCGSHNIRQEVQWLSGRVLDSRPRGFNLTMLQSGFPVRAFPEKKNTLWGWGEEDGSRYIFLWVVGAESFQIIWVIGVRLNLITWVVGVSLFDQSNNMGFGVSLSGRGRKNIICQKKREVLSNLAKNRAEHSKPMRKLPFLFMPNRQNSDVSVQYW